LPSEVEDVISVCRDNGFVAPTLYQGNYSAVARKQEVELFPVLRKHGIALNACSALVRGFLAKAAKDFEGYIGRFDAGNPVDGVYMALYKRPAFLEALSD
jgi:aflatoxin B1 aldehyde reductase